MKEMLIKNLRKYLWGLMIVFIFNVISMAFNIFLPLMYRYLIDEIVVNGQIEIMFRFSLLMIGLFCFSNLLDFFGKKIYCSILIKIHKNLKEGIYEHVQRIPMSYYKSKSRADFISRIINDTATLIQVFNDFLYPGALGLLSLLGVIIILFKMQWILALSCISSIPIFVYVSQHFGNQAQKISKEVKKNTAEHLGVLDECLRSIIVNKAFNYYKQQKIIYSRQLDKLMNNNYRLLMNKIYSQQIFSLTASIFPIIVLILGSYMILDNTITIGTLIAFISYLNYLYNPVTVLARINIAYKEAKVSYKRISEVMNMPLECDKAIEQVKQNDLVENDRDVSDNMASKIEFENVSCVINDRVVLKNVSFVIEPGELVAIIGKNGVGKSTILNLILRFIEPSKGKIYIDNEAIDSINIYKLRDKISLVPQECFLYSSTIRENILVGNADVTEKEIEDILQLVKLFDFVKGLPKKLDTELNFRDNDFSGGEKQKLALARALIKKSSILLLDEATANVDIESSDFIINTLINLKKKKTILIVTHNMKYMHLMDKVIFIENSQNYVFDKHDNLMKTNENYRKLYLRKII